MTTGGSDTRARLEGDVSAAEADISRLRTANAALADAFRAEPTDGGKEELKRAAASLAAARDRLEAARAALAVFERTGSPHGLVAEDGRVFGSVAVEVAAGTSRADREAAIDRALGAALGDIAAELGVVLAAAPERYTRERPGRDPEGRTVLDVTGRVEGDVLVPGTTPARGRGR